ncbi:MAG: NAD(P)/FAD-dependent oxidoreductase [Clostridia bacterium]|nr:NAD(P)/FAD-dependent oxidoreductase [Clostridia bacterium]
MKVCVIGGGASGLMASVLLARRGVSVSLFEKNKELGKKILITGKGRCNVTTIKTGEEFLENVIRGKKFLLSAEKNFSSNKTIEFFENLGVKLKVERGGRVFPVSDDAKTIRDAFVSALKKEKVEINLNSEVSEILVKNDKFYGIVVNGKKLDFDACVIATGGLSYQTTGSTGDGLKFAKNVGHSITEVKPALNGIKVKEKLNLEGLSLKNVKVSAVSNGKIVYSSEIGEMLFTKVGISGPLVLTMSSYVNRSHIEKIIIDFKPALSNEQINARIEREIKANGKKQLKTLLRSFLPERLVEEFVLRLKVNGDLKISQLTKETKNALIGLFKSFELTMVEVEPIETSVITSGGVSLDEISPKDMSSKKVSNLFFIGECLDVDALTGGFNLQIAFMTANACANSKLFEEVI